jgi:hypothetical protein
MGMGGESILNPPLMFSPIANEILSPSEVPERTEIDTCILSGQIGYPIRPHALLREHPASLRREIEIARRRYGGDTLAPNLLEREVNIQAAMHQMAACWSIAGARNQDLVAHLNDAREPESREFQMIFLWKNIRDMVCPALLKFLIAHAIRLLRSRF